MTVILLDIDGLRQRWRMGFPNMHAYCQGDILRLCDEVERLRAENAQLQRRIGNEKRRTRRAEARIPDRWRWKGHIPPLNR